MCRHMWLPKQGRLFRYVTCARCHEMRRVRFRWTGREPRTIIDALGEAIDRGVIANNEVTWGGKAIR